jgi:Zn-dependent peptidase ImmA (M78 family)
LVEREANQIAAELLMPVRSLNLLLGLGYDLTGISEVLIVSERALSIRFKDKKLVSMEDFGIPSFVL